MERESMTYGVVIVGAGPAGLAAAIRLKQLAAEAQREISVCILEKGSEVGAHILSGAVLEPRALAELVPDWQAQHLQTIAEHGHIGWQRTSGYNWRALVEFGISRWKRVIGDGLRSRTDGRQRIEVAIAAHVLNRMLDLGRPEYVRLA